MPTYEYECDACGHKFDVFQSINEDKLTKCPECGKRKLRRLFGAGAAVVFKGSGFYQTDYRSQSYKSSAEADKKAGSGSGEGGSTAADSSAKPTASETKKADPPKGKSEPKS
ncbi:MAG: zinc ribbon domain-containing protein [Planctomycetes bacterium]|nr:zinc ribbon domain-containing protein [Planctomycetota bacterium]